MVDFPSEEEGGRSFLQTGSDHSARQCVPVEFSQLFFGFGNSVDCNFFRRSERDGLRKRMLPQVIRILYVLSFFFFQGGFIR